MQYTAILVDLDGVIRKWRPSDEAIEIAYDLPVGSIRRIAFSPEFLDPAITGTISDEEWRERIAARLAGDYRASRAREAVALWTSYPGEIDQKALSILSDCEGSSRLVLATNATSRLPRDLLALGLSGCFHSVINSSQVGVRKPAADFFRIALQMAGVSAERSLFVDDTAVNVAAAGALGIRSHLHTGRNELAEFLRKAGVLRAVAAKPLRKEGSNGG